MSRHQYRRGKTPFRRGGSDSTPSPRARGQCYALRGRTSNPVRPREYGQCRSHTRTGRACVQALAEGSFRAGFRHEGRSRAAIRLTGLYGQRFAMRGALGRNYAAGLCRAIFRHAGRSRAIIRHIPCLRWRTIAQERRMRPNIARQSPAWGIPPESGKCVRSIRNPFSVPMHYHTEDPSAKEAP